MRPARLARYLSPLFAFAAWAQTELCVSVRDPRGLPVASARVRLEPRAAAAVITAETGPDGTTCHSAQPGQYVVRIQHDGFAGAAGTVSLLSGQPRLEREFTLSLASTSSQVEVTASRLPDTLLESPAPVTQLDRQRLKYLGARGLNDALQEQPEVVTFAGGSHANGGSTNIQGSTSRNVEILVDGQPLSGRVSGYIDLNQIDSSIVEAVEIKAGASAMTYGLQGQGGAINLITRRASTGTHGAVEAGYGSVNAGLLRAEGGFAAKGWAALVAGAQQRNLGYNLDSASAIPTQAPSEVRNLFGSLYAPTWGRLNAGLTALYMDQSYWGFDNNATLGTYDFERPKKRLVLLPRATLALNGENILGFRARHLYYRSAEDLFYRPSSTFSRTATTQQADGGEMEWTYLHPSGFRSFVGVSFTRQDIIGSRLGTLDGNATRDSWSQLSSVEYTLWRRLKLQGGYRADHDSVFGNKASPQLIAAYRLGSGLSLSGSLTRGFRAPDFSELYLNNTHAGGRVRVLGNPELSPEQSWSSTAGLLFTRSNKFRLEGRLFEHRLHGMILSRLQGREGIASIYRYMNVGDARIRGALISAGTVVARRLELTASYQYLHTRDLTAGQPLEYSPRQRATFSGAYSNRRLGLLASLFGNLTGRTFFALTNNVQDYMNAFELFGANVQKDLGRRTALRFTFRNLTDNVNPAYRTTAPFSVEASIRFRLGSGEEPHEERTSELESPLADPRPGRRVFRGPAGAGFPDRRPSAGGPRGPRRRLEPTRHYHVQQSGLARPQGRRVPHRAHAGRGVAERRHPSGPDRRQTHRHRATAGLLLQ